MERLPHQQINPETLWEQMDRLAGKPMAATREPPDEARTLEEYTDPNAEWPSQASSMAYTACSTRGISLPPLNYGEPDPVPQRRWWWPFG